MRKLIIISASLLMILQVVVGQNTKHYTPVNMYMMNTLLINPGYAGTKEAMSGSLMYGNNWAGMPGAGTLMAMSFDSPINWLKGRVALGGLATSSTYGLNTNTNVYGYYNYRIPIGQGKLGLGLRGGVNNYSRRLTKADFREPNDPVQLDESRWFPNFGLGIFWFTADYYVGLSIPDFFFPPSGSNAFDHDVANYNYTIVGGYIFTASDNFRIKPSALVTYTQNSPLVYQATLNFILLNDMLWLGASYKPNGIVGLVEFQFQKWLRLGYAYEFPTGDLVGFTSGSHEILLRLVYNKKLKVVSPGYFW